MTDFAPGPGPGPATGPRTAANGLPAGVVVAALATAAGMTPGLLGLSFDPVPTGAIQGFGWPAFGVVAALLLDRDPRSRLGRSFAIVAVLPALVTLTALAAPGVPDGWTRIEHLWGRLGIAPVVAALAVIAWGVGIADDRMARRRLVWLVVWSGILVGALVAAAVAAGPRANATVMTLGLWAMAGVVFNLVRLRELRPVDEPLIDVAIVATTIACGAGVGTLVRVASTRADLAGADISGAFAAVVTAVLVFPAGLWCRRLFLQHRYGHGTLTAADVAEITADLHSLVDARDLLSKAAAMVRAASGHRQVHIVLGPEVPEVPSHWVLYPLVVGGDRVGTVFLESAHPQGPEPRQQRIVAQLLPTVALMAKAVSLAVEADHARRDVARQRDAERSRILGDLHDGLGPVLVGMSMRVRAELRRAPTPLLEALADDLADCRGDLRRIVSGLTPSVLDDGDLATALQRLVASFADHGPTVTLNVSLDNDLALETAVAVYRSAAEGVSNAVRHARARRIAVDVHTASDGTVVVEVSDDGTGGPIAWGVGLSSLRRRAHELGGHLQVGAVEPTGIRLRMQLPVRQVMA